MTSPRVSVLDSEPRPRRHVVATVVALLVVLTALVSCSADDEASDSAGAPAAGLAGGAGGTSGDSAAVAESASDADKGSPSDSAGLSQAQLEAGRQQVLRADLVVQTDTVLTDARRAQAAAAAAGGVVTDEQTATDPGVTEGDAGRTVSTLTMRVPPDALDDLLTSLTSLGILVSQSRGTVDVTDEYVDVQARIVSQRASLDRLLALVTDASDLSDVVALENEVSRRQSDLDALVARQKALDEEVSLATITLTLTSEADDAVVVREAGFVTGLRSGWDAFTSSLVGALTVLGALLPFLALLALIGAPLYLVRRRRSAPSPAPVAGPPAA